MVKIQARINLLLDFIVTICSILSLTNFNLDIPTFLISINEVGRIYLILIVGCVFSVRSFFYLRTVLKNIEIRLGNKIKEDIGSLKTNLISNIDNLDRAIKELDKKIAKVEAKIDIIKEYENNMITKLLEKML
ncbi:hypothetical protein [Methanosarcina sp.]|uniref:hypothetical protein n=1 Tax=Methanosarcina sp. TaxID=2213 RepID=UPI003BB6FD2B